MHRNVPRTKTKLIEGLTFPLPLYCTKKMCCTFIQQLKYKKFRKKNDRPMSHSIQKSDFVTYL